MGRLAVADQKLRDEYLVELIKTSGKKGVTSTIIADDIGISRNNATRYMKKFLESHPEISSVSGGPGTATSYVWAEPEKPTRLTHSPFLKNRYEKTNKNNEGYTDMTATTAIRNADRSDMLIAPKPGEIWCTEESNGKNSYIFILSYDGNAAQCIKFYDVKEFSSPETLRRPVRVTLGAVTYIGDSGRVTYKPKKYFLRRARCSKEEELMKVRKDVADALEISAFRIEKVEVPGPERIVEVPGPERIVYKPLEVPEGCVDAKDAKISALEEQVKIWKSAFWGLIHSKDPVAK